MPDHTLLRRAVRSGVVASLTSSAALAAVARLEGRAALQPINATSHWLNREPAARVTRADLRHTGVGYATHLAATIFWAALFEAWIARSRPAPTGPVPFGTRLRDAAAVSALAAAVDYLATPKRFTPGWEFVLSPQAMAVAYVAMALGFVASPTRSA